jgi:hypothetical protein
VSSLESFTRGDLKELVEDKWIGKVTIGILDAIAASFQTDNVIRPVQTRDEISRRFKICIKWFNVLRRDLHWSVPRILDGLPEALRSELDGTPFQPTEDRQGWVGA